MARYFEFRAVSTAVFVLVFFASPFYASCLLNAQELHGRASIERREEAPPSYGTSQEVAKILDQARSATGFSKLGNKRVLRATGKATLFGVPCEFSGDYSVNGKFRTAVEGDLEQIFIFDGRQGWEKSLFAGHFR